MKEKFQNDPKEQWLFDIDSSKSNLPTPLADRVLAQPKKSGLLSKRDKKKIVDEKAIKDKLLQQIDENIEDHESLINKLRKGPTPPPIDKSAFGGRRYMTVKERRKAAAETIGMDEAEFNAVEGALEMDIFEEKEALRRKAELEAAAPKYPMPPAEDRGGRAATQIQSTFRGHRARKQVGGLREDIHMASEWRAQNPSEEDVAARKIQGGLKIVQ
eukprot:gene620-1811_t